MTYKRWSNSEKYLYNVEPHPLFKVIEGEIEPWEKIKKEIKQMKHCNCKDITIWDIEFSEETPTANCSKCGKNISQSKLNKILEVNALLNNS